MPDERAMPPVRRFSFTTGDLEQAHDVLTRLYTSHRTRLHYPADSFEFRQEAVEAGPIMLGRVRYRMDVDVQLEPLDRLMFVIVAGGQVETQSQTDSVRALPGDVFVTPVGVPLGSICRHVDCYTLSLDLDQVAEAAAGWAGIEATSMRFTSMEPVSAGMARHFRDTMAYLRRLLTGPDEPLRNPLVLNSAVDLVATSALVAFPNTATAAGYQPGAGPVPPAAVRRAVSFIETHAGEPITAAQIAAEARISSRALQSGFRRHLDTTPMAYLRRVRLDRAHHDLQAADPTRGDTVAIIARRWGYAGMSKFSADYRATFGRPPSHTLRA